MKYINNLRHLALIGALAVISGCTCTRHCSGGEPMASLGTALALRDVHFAYDSAKLSPTAKQALQEDFENLGLADSSSKAKIILEGRADARGASKYNQQLSNKRVASVKSYLMKLGASETKFESRALGETAPIAKGANPDAWAKNRSVRVLAM